LFLDFHHLVGQVAAFCNDAVQRHSHVEPFAGDREISGDRRKSNRLVPFEIFPGKLLEFLSSRVERLVDERLADERLASVVHEQIEHDKNCGSHTA
jgi:hypothetical protein